MTRDEIKKLWDPQRETQRVLDEHGNNVANAQLQRTADGVWLYVDEVDGWKTLTDAEAALLIGR